MIAALLADELGPITRDGARRAAAEELADHRYADAQPPLALRAIGAALRALGRVLDEASARAPAGRAGLFLLLLLFLGAIGLLVARTGAPRRRTVAGTVFGSGSTDSAADHRARAERAAAGGAYAEAVRERLRAVVRHLEAAGLLDPAPGRTAAEVAQAAGAALPGLGERFVHAARLFDEVEYGGRTADASSYAVLVALDDAVRAPRAALR